MSRTLIVYYSRRGENYVGGVIKKLQQGNTEYVASKIAALTGAESFRIETVKTHPAGYTEVLKTCRKLGIGFISWGLTGKGYLTGNINPCAVRRSYPGHEEPDTHARECRSHVCHPDG